jgi:hypothetical protein
MLRSRLLVPLVAISVLLVACASAVVTPSPTVSSPIFAPAATPASESPSQPSPAASPASPLASPTPTNATGFAFAADAVAAYYESQGYACVAPQTSPKAAGFSVRTCQKVDDAGRTLAIGLVTDPDGGLASGFANVKGKDGETMLAPIDALDPLAGFLGAMLGEDRGTALLTWLASHLGDTRAETASGSITIATHAESETDHSTLYVEVASAAYFDAVPTATPRG